MTATPTGAAVRMLDFSGGTDALIPTRLAELASAQPEREALSCDGRRLNWRELAVRMEGIARGLLALGCRPGDRVGILAENSVDYVAWILGAVRCRLTIVPLPCLTSPATLERLVLDADLVCLAASSRFAEVAGGAVTAARRFLPGGLVAIDFKAPGWRSLAELETAAVDIRPDDARPEDPFNIIYSSGTTGTPKGIVQTHNLRATQSSAFGSLGFGADCSTILCTPLYANFSFGGLLVTLWSGGRVVLMSRFGEEGFLALCREQQPTHAFVVPVQIERLLGHPDFDRSVAHGPMLKYAAGSPMRQSTKAETLRRWPGPLVEVYGMTEGGAVTALFAHEHPNKLGSVGRVVGGGEIVIVGDDGQVLAPGQVGEIVGRAGPAMSGYHKRPDLSAELLWSGPDGEQYLRSGDLGYLDDDGFLYLSGRKKDVIISGGLNIYAVDLEEVLADHPDVAEAAVIGVPSERFDETPLALVVPRSGAATSEEEICQWANARLGKAQRISAVEFRESLPRGAIGKVLKTELRAPYWERNSRAAGGSAGGRSDA
jgi:acyl-CoA synthetase (AMP-forming)/AMP-acid ligase II